LVPQHGRRCSRVIPSARDVSAGLSKPVEDCMTDLRDRLKAPADWSELHARHGQDVDKRFDEDDQVIVLNDDATGRLCKRWQGPATVVRIISPNSYFIDIGDGRVRHVYAGMMCNFHAHTQSCDSISEIDVNFSRALVPATVVCDILPSVDVGHSGIENLDLGQQDELIDEFAACFSEELVLCRVCRIWLLFVFLVCGVVVLSMTACFEYEIVKLITVVWHRCCVIWRVCECIVSIAVSSRVCVSNI